MSEGTYQAFTSCLAFQIGIIMRLYTRLALGHHVQVPEEQDHDRDAWLSADILTTTALRLTHRNCQDVD